MQTADAVVIGAGINGAASAYNLVKRGVEKVVLIDKHLIASGGTGRSAAIIRQHYSNVELVRMVKHSVEIFHNFADAVGGDGGFVNTGWAFLIPDHVSDGLSGNMKLGQEHGVDVREIMPDELHEIEPRIDLSDVHRIVYEPDAGYADPRRSTYAYVRRFLDLGGDLKELTSVIGLLTDGGRITGVQTDKGDISCETVVNAAGPWAHHIAATVGVEIPIRVTREEEIICETLDVGGPPRLCFSDMAKAIYYRPEGPERTLIGRGFPKEYQYVDPDGYNQEVDTTFIHEITERFRARWPSFKKALFVNSYTGLYDVTPDWHPVLGRIDQVAGLILCAGFSGHGFKIAPSIGELMAVEIVDGAAHSIDISRFNLRRFERGELFTAAYGANRA